MQCAVWIIAPELQMCAVSRDCVEMLLGTLVRAFKCCWQSRMVLLSEHESK